MTKRQRDIPQEEIQRGKETERRNVREAKGERGKETHEDIKPKRQRETQRQKDREE